MFTFSSRVRYSECDETARLGFVPLVNYLQDCSTFHTETIGLGLDFMADNHFAWLLAAWQIEVFDRPRFCDDIVVGTWCYGMTRTFAQRNFSICAPDGTPYVHADSLWFTFDTEAMRPCRIPESEQAYLTSEARLPMPPTIRKIKAEGPYEEGEHITVNAQHLDTNQHVNNAQYLMMALEALPADYEPHHICIQYLKQARLGDLVIPRIHHDGAANVVELADAEGEPFAIVRLDDAPRTPGKAASEAMA